MVVLVRGEGGARRGQEAEAGHLAMEMVVHIALLVLLSSSLLVLACLLVNGGSKSQLASCGLLASSLGALEKKAWVGEGLL